MLWCDETVGHESPKPVWDVDYVVVTLFLVHGCHHLVNLGMDRRVVALTLVQERVVMSGGGTEVVLASNLL